MTMKRDSILWLRIRRYLMREWGFSHEQIDQLTPYQIRLYLSLPRGQ